MSVDVDRLQHWSSGAEEQTCPPVSLPSTLTLAQYGFTLEAVEPLELSPFKGSALRGGFGHTFKRLVCTQRCEKTCRAGNACAYGYIFDTSPPDEAEQLRNFSEVPRPFVIHAPTDRRTRVEPGQTLRFGLTLIGRAVDYLPYFIAVFQELGRVGLGRTRGRYRLLAVDGVSPWSRTTAPVYRAADDALRAVDLTITSEIITAYAAMLTGDRGPETEEHRKPKESPISPSPNPPPPQSPHPPISQSPISQPPNLQSPNPPTSQSPITPSPISPSPISPSLTLDFLTPTRLKQRGRWVNEGPPFAVLIRTLLGRISSLSYFHCGEPFEADFRSLIDRAAEVEIIHSETHWSNWSRFSSRQKQRVAMGGLVGRVTYAGPLEPYLPLLALGELVHVGKGTVFGNGQYRAIKAPEVLML